MGIFDKAKDVASQNADAVRQGVDKAGDFVDERTGGKFADQVDQGQEFVKNQLDGNQQQQPPNAQGGQQAGSPLEENPGQ